MQSTDEDSSPPASGPRAAAPDSRIVSSAPHDAAGAPSSDPSDPDAAMYAAMRARPDWTAKPAARAAIEELSRGLESGEDPLFWEVAKPGDIQVSDAQEHASLVMPEAHAAARDGARPTGLESRRLYVAPTADPRSLATVRSPGRNGPPLPDTPLVATLVSHRAAQSSSRPPPRRGASEERPRRGLPIAIAGVGVLVISATLVALSTRSRGVESAPAALSAPSPPPMVALAAAPSAVIAAPPSVVTASPPAGVAPPPSIARVSTAGKPRPVASVPVGSVPVPSRAPPPSATGIEVDTAPPVALPSVSPQPTAAVRAPTKSNPGLPENQPKF